MKKLVLTSILSTVLTTLYAEDTEVKTSMGEARPPLVMQSEQRPPSQEVTTAGIVDEIDEEEITQSQLLGDLVEEDTAELATLEEETSTNEETAPDEPVSLENDLDDFE